MLRLGLRYIKLIKHLFEKFKEAFFAVFPVAAIVLVLSLTVAKASFFSIISFIIATILLIIGMTFFTLGADVSMMKIGQSIGSHITKSRSILLVTVVCFILGVIATIAEPDLRVLADSLEKVVDPSVMIISVAVGVGIFLVVSFFRVYLQVKLSYILLVMYGLIFVLAMSPLIPNNFVAVAFDSGGVTTGPITVPFIMALGVGLASVRGDKNSAEDSFGLVALCSIGPIITVLILGALNGVSGVEIGRESAEALTSISAVFYQYVKELPDHMVEVAVALLPILVFFIIFQIFSLKLGKVNVIQILVGLIYTYIGLVLFLTGVNVGFMPMGSFIGEAIGESNMPWLLLPIGAVIGWFIVSAEPAVHVLKHQVEDVTEGAVKGKSVGFALSIGVALSVALALLRVITGMSIWYILIPGYLFSLVMTFLVPPIFTAIAFDSGGVASGPMTATFLLPLALGACSAVNGNPLTDAYGLVAFVAMTPLVTIQLLGLIAKIKTAIARRAVEPVVSIATLSDEIVEFDIYEEESEI